MKDINLLRIKFSLDVIPENVSWFGTLKFLDACSCEYYTYVFKNVIKMRFTQYCCTQKEDLKAVNASVSSEEGRNNSGEGIRKAKFGRDGTIINLVKIAPRLCHL